MSRAYRKTFKMTRNCLKKIFSSKSCVKIHNRGKRKKKTENQKIAKKLKLPRKILGTKLRD